MSAVGPISRETLLAYADGQLPQAEAETVAAYLAANPEAAAEVALWARQDDSIRTLFGPAGAEPVPPRLKPRRLAAEMESRNRGRWRWAAAAVVLLGIGLGAGWLTRPLLESRPATYDILIASAVNAHRVFAAENRHAVEVASNDRDHLVTWLSNRLETEVGTPDLSVEGFTLKGGRLLPADPQAGGRAAQLMYENAAGERVTVYITAALPDPEPAYEFASLDGAEAFYWANARITCTVVGTLPQERMQTVSRTVYRQLTGGSTGMEEYRGMS
ncbi:anti-sigma factor family protein [Devosia nitrariae]|uniref:Transcriptional regulator n=1 Tax=Devosia nitrariae TaxID=2071872 RepID=A0ABQ5WB53_9HYPH|nr:anti-sigma factor [Devosia nitrariae]GLQ57093.1 transcriptional regulator [Devosia nitrariae]